MMSKSCWRSSNFWLRVGGRLYGEVLRKDGSPARHRAVRLLQRARKDEPSGAGLLRNIVTDGQGRFDESHLRPGVWGLLYWYPLVPFHLIIFKLMCREIDRRARLTDSE